MLASEEQVSTGGPVRSVDSKHLLDAILTSLDDNKAENIVTIDLAGKTSIADHMVIANGRSNRQVSALSNYLTQDIKQGGFGSCKVEGLPQADWVLIDAGDVIVHVFRPEVREFYRLEKMWSVDLDSDDDAPQGGSA